VRGTVNDGFAVFYDPPRALGIDCATLLSGGTLLLQVTGDLVTSQLVEAEPPGGEALPLDLPVLNPSCAHEVGDLLVLRGANDVREFGEVVALDRRTMEAETLTKGVRCNDLVGDLRRSDQEVLIVRTCDDAAESGMYLLPLGGGAERQILPGRIAAPSLSPDEQWAVSAQAPLGSDTAESARVWAIRLDGSGLHRVTEGPSSFPVWVSDELEPAAAP
jgi:hypothetical protein